MRHGMLSWECAWGWGSLLPVRAAQQEFIPVPASQAWRSASPILMLLSGPLDWKAKAHNFDLNTPLNCFPLNSCLPDLNSRVSGSSPPSLSLGFAPALPDPDSCPTEGKACQLLM